MKKAQTLDRYSAAKQAVTVAQQNLKTSELNLERRQSLYEKGLRSKRDLELAEQEMVKNKTELERALVQLEVARKEMEVADFELSKTDADTMAKIDSTSASLSSARETVATTEADIQKLIIEIGSLENRIVQRILTAPCDGKVVRLLVAGAGETVSAGTQMAVIAPATNDLAAELVVKGNDAPLISTGRPVRLQFAGWPAVQFTGWPSVAVGTFAGRVSVVDAVDDGTGKFRIIVVPDEKAVELNEDQPWPSSQFLRPGSEVHGWVMLNTVPLGFELWRQFNAFPPSLNKEEMQSKLGDVKRKSK
jgi:multidrug resistance efflux pump